MRRYFVPLLFIIMLSFYNIYLIHFEKTFSITTMQTDQLANIEQYIDKNTLVFIDVDNTILAAGQTIGTDQWFEDRASQYKILGYNQKRAVKTALDEWIKIQEKTKVQPIETNTASIVRMIQNKAKNVIALTARPSSLSDLTAKQLQSIGIDLSINNNFNMQYLDSNLRSLYKKGIITTGLSHKGETIEKFLAKKKISLEKISKVVFIDDKQNNVSHVAHSMKNLKINYVGITYNGAFAAVKNYRSDLADQQYRIFDMCNKLISDKLTEKTPYTADCEQFT